MSSKQKEDADYEEYESLKQSKFKQQKLPGWRHYPSMLNAILFFFSIGILSIGIGVALFLFSEDIVEEEFDYYNNQSSFVYNISKDMKADIMVYYKVYNFYQNNRRFMNSRSEDQLRGKNITKNDMEDRHECDPIISNENLNINLSIDNLDGKELANPCGLLARSFILFNDKFTFSFINGTEIPINDTNIARKYDIDNYKSSNSSKPWTNIEDEHFLVWMRPSPFANFTKLYGRINRTLYKDTQIKITIESGKYFNETEFQISNINKTIVLATVNSFGGKNNELALSYGIFGLACIVLGISFIIAFKCHDKKDK